MPKISQKYQVFVILIVIILAMVIIKIKYGYRGQKNDQLLTSNFQTPTVAPTVDKDYPLQSHLPYQGKGFVIDKYVAPNTLNLKLTTATQTEAAKEIGVWLNSFGDAGSGQILQLEEATPTGKLKITN